MHDEIMIKTKGCTSDDVAIMALLPLKVCSSRNRCCSDSLDSLLRLEAVLQVWEQVFVLQWAGKRLCCLFLVGCNKRLLPELKHARDSTIKVAYFSKKSLVLVSIATVTQH